MDDYEMTVRVGADRAAVLRALTEPERLSAWWTKATGSGETGGELRFWFGHAQPLVIKVAEARDGLVCWDVVACDFLPDWVGTRPRFSVEAVGPSCEIRFVHRGLTPELDCHEQCVKGWDHFIPSLARYLDDGVGAPKGSPDELARRSIGA